MELTLKQKLILFRGMNHYSRREASKKLGVSQDVIKQIEDGTDNMRQSTRDKLTYGLWNDESMKGVHPEPSFIEQPGINEEEFIKKVQGKIAAAAKGFTVTATASEWEIREGAYVVPCWYIVAARSGTSIVQQIPRYLGPDENGILRSSGPSASGVARICIRGLVDALVGIASDEYFVEGEQ